MNTIAISPADNYAAPVVPTSAPIIKLATAISAVMAEIGVIAKGGRNEFHRYDYARMEDVLQHLTPLMAKHGIVVLQTETSRAMFDEDRVVSVSYHFTLAHISGEVWPERLIQTGMCRCRDSKGGFDDKALNKCHTSARKYFLLALFQIPTGDTDDGDGDAGADAKERPAKQIDRDRYRAAAETVNDEPAKVLGREAASRGKAILKVWTEGLDREVRARLKPHIMRELMPIAEAADEHAAKAPKRQKKPEPETESRDEAGDQDRTDPANVGGSSSAPTPSPSGELPIDQGDIFPPDRR